MLLAIAALLVQVPAVPQRSISIATTAAADLSSGVVFTPGRPGRIMPEPASPATVSPTSESLPLSAPRAFVAPVYLAPAKLRYERPSRGLWLTLSIAQYGFTRLFARLEWITFEPSVPFPRPLLLLGDARKAE
jgi:hypothetical protein